MSVGRRLLLATGSEHKLAELRELLDVGEAELLSLADALLMDDAPEEGATFEENATAKATYYAVRSGLPTLADDSGLEVDALGGRPGVRTRRYAGESATDEENNAFLLRELEGVPAERRTARYRCVLVLAEAQPDGSMLTLEAAGTFEGRIALEPRGAGERARRRPDGGAAQPRGEKSDVASCPGRPPHERAAGAESELSRPAR